MFDVRAEGLRLLHLRNAWYLPNGKKNKKQTLRVYTSTLSRNIYIRHILHRYMFVYVFSCFSVRTKGGVHYHENKLEVTVPSALFIKALDVILQRMVARGFPFGKVVALSGGSQVNFCHASSNHPRVNVCIAMRQPCHKCFCFLHR